MFKKKPATVAEAVAPFKQVRDGLRAVVTQATARRQAADASVSEAEKHLAAVRKDARAESEVAAAEIDQARKVLDALAALVGNG